MNKPLYYVVFTICIMAIVSCDRNNNNKYLNTEFQLLVDFTTDQEGNPTYHLAKKELQTLTSKIKSATGKRGAIKIRSSAVGSFSGSNQKEVMHIAFQDDPTASHAEGWGHTYFVIINNDSIKIINPGECGADRIFKTIRMPNGLDYLLMTSEFSGQGAVEVAAGLVSLADNPLNTAILVKNFNIIYSNNCAGIGGEESGKTVTSKLLYKWNNDKLEFKRDHFVKKCSDSSKFQFIETSDKSDEEF